MAWEGAGVGWFGFWGYIDEGGFTVIGRGGFGSGMSSILLVDREFC